MNDSGVEGEADCAGEPSAGQCGHGGTGMTTEKRRTGVPGAVFAAIGQGP